MDTEIFNHMLQMVISAMEAFQAGPLKVKINNFRDAKIRNFLSPEHEHYFYEFCYMKENSSSYQIQEDHFTLQAHDSTCVLIPSLQPHLRKAYSPQDVFNISTMAHLIIEPVSPQYAMQLSMFRETLYYRHFQFHYSAHFMDLDEQLRTILEEQKPYWAEHASCKLKELILTFFSENFPDLSIHEYTPYIKKYQETIGRFLFMIAVWSHSPVTTAFIAEKVGLSERHLARLVKAEFGMSLGEFITMKRMEHAKKLLAGNTRLIKDVAMNLGFRDASHFCRVFRKFFGITPKQYMQQIAARELEMTEKSPPLL